MTSYTATYSPDDNKLRLYASARLDPETYARVKAAGFAWAPKQDLFVAPMWTPAREDLARELAGEIEDEDRTLLDRAEDRAERFDEYSDKRAEDAARAHAAVDGIAGRFEFGQPILIGHHSQRRAEKDKERMEAGMRKAVRAFETSAYWAQRAAGAIAHAKYKERPEVRARRIKTIEADARKNERNKAAALQHLSSYERLSCPEGMAPTEKYPHGLLHAYLCSYGGGLTYDAADALRKSPDTLPQVLEQAKQGQRAYVAHCDRWAQHYEFRLAYERAMLGEQGRADLLVKPKRPAPPPLLNYRAPGGSIRCVNIYNRGEFVDYPQVEMTAAEYAKIHADYKGTRNPCDTVLHRVRTCMQPAARGYGLVCVFLTDSKAHPVPERLGAAQEAGA